MENCKRIKIAFDKIFKYRFYLRLKNVHQNGIYEFHFNREITQLRNVEKLLNITEDEDEIPLKHQNLEMLGYSGLKLDNIYFCLISLIFGSIVSLLFLITEILFYSIQRKRSRIVRA